METLLLGDRVEVCTNANTNLAADSGLCCNKSFNLAVGTN